MIVAALPLVLVAVLGGGIAINEAKVQTEPTEVVQTVDQSQTQLLEAIEDDNAH